MQSITLTVRLSPAEMDRVEKVAREHQRSKSNLVRAVLAKALQDPQYLQVVGPGLHNQPTKEQAS